jgi:ABC-2 type transport system ATP-binding protein
MGDAGPVAEQAAVSVDGLRHRYGERLALDDLSLDVARGEIFGLLGPNGGGKTTLFKILSTILAPTAGRVRILEHDLIREARHVRRHLGVVFQHPAVDPQLTVLENLQHHGLLYGMRGRLLAERAAQVLARVGLAERAGERVKALSGGLQRRVELAKAVVHQPDILLLDEPSTGLDPGARRDFTHYLEHLRTDEGVTVLLTTHLLDEAERCDRLAILHQGRLVALGTPNALKDRVGGDVVVIHSHAAESLGEKIRLRFGCQPLLVDGNLRIEMPEGHELVRAVVNAFGPEVDSVHFGKPTLEDAFIHLTGLRLWDEERA